MLKRLDRPTWTCARCLRRGRNARRSLITSSASAIAQDHYHPVTKAAPSTAHDDRTLRQVFDSHEFWREFSSKAKRGYGGINVGLFQNRYLTTPDGFQTFANVTLRKCENIVERVLSYESEAQYKRIVKDLDRLSDLLCRVIDMSDFVRSVHPSPAIQAAATQAYITMFQYMNKLNTTRGLNDQLIKANSSREVRDSWSEEERTVARILIEDFSRSAIDNDDADRMAFVDISDEIARIGNGFVENMAPEKDFISLQSNSLKGMEPLLVRQFTRWGKVALPTQGMPAMAALRTVEDPDTRKNIYVANRSSSKQNLHRLTRFLKLRTHLAKLSKYETFAHLALSDKMAGSPEAVTSFLEALSQDNAPRVKKEVDELHSLKVSMSGGQADALNAWDRDYYTAQLRGSVRSKSRTPDFLSAYFSLGTVFQGLSRLFHRLYGIRLIPRETLPGETWNDDVRRLDVVDDREGHIAVIYCDLFERAGKSPNPAHFTLRCSRKIGDDEMKEAAEISSLQDSPFATAQEAVSDGLSVNYNSRDGNALYQLPTIALICDFALPSAGNRTRPALLTFQELTTLFHEMGHALHSMCGRTALQNVSGTRCATDFAELPSVLMENFASAPEVLALYARHWETDAPLDPERIKERVAIDRMMQGAEVESQILLGMLDQRYHSALPATWSENDVEASTRVYHDVWKQYSSLPEPAGTSWQGFFGHLFGYGATYYSYLFDRAIAGKIWRDVFQRHPGGAVDPEAGERFREEVLRWGGGRNGWRCVAGVLGDGDGILAEGGSGGMKMVGQWGVHT